MVKMIHMPFERTFKKLSTGTSCYRFVLMSERGIEANGLRDKYEWSLCQWTPAPGDLNGLYQDILVSFESPKFALSVSI